MKIILFLIATASHLAAETITRDWISFQCYDPTNKKCVTRSGKNEQVGSGSFESIWTQGSLYPWPTTTFTAVLSSSDAADVGQLVVIEGLDENLDMASATAILNGQTTVAVDGVWWRIHNIFNYSDNQNAFSGTAYIAQDGITTWSAGVPQVTTSIVATATSTPQQSLMASFTTARNQYAYLYDARVTSDNNQGSECWLFVRPWGKTFVAVSDTYVTEGDGFTVQYRIPKTIGPETDVDIRCVAIGGSSRISASYGLYLESR